MYTWLISFKVGVDLVAEHYTVLIWYLPANQTVNIRLIYTKLDPNLQNVASITLT